VVSSTTSEAGDSMIGGGRRMGLVGKGLSIHSEEMSVWERLIMVSTSRVGRGGGGPGLA
jgi:hypothetical protein